MRMVEDDAAQRQRDPIVTSAPANAITPKASTTMSVCVSAGGCGRLLKYLQPHRVGPAHARHAQAAGQEAARWAVVCDVR